MRYWLYLICVLISGAGNAQIPALTLEKLTTREGMPSNDVWCLANDKQGFLWIGTGRSVCRYDGYDFLRLDSLKVGYATGISLDSKGNIYTSVDTKGLCKIDAKTLEVRTLVENNYDDEDTGNDLHLLGIVDSYDKVWVCDYNSVKCYDPGSNTIKRYSFALKASGGDAYDFANFFEDSHRTLWVVTEIGLYRYDREADKLICVLGQEAVLPRNRIPITLSRATEDSEGNLWIGGYKYGLVRFSPEDQSFQVRKQGFEHNDVICAAQSLDENGKKLLFVGTSDGVSVLYPEKNELYHLPEFYKNGIRVKGMSDDKTNGILWIATSEGVYKYRYRNIGIQTITIPPDIVRLPVQVTNIAPTPEGRYLLGLSHSGALEWTPGTNAFRLLRYPVNAITQQVRWLGNKGFAFTDKGIFTWELGRQQFSVWKPASALFKNTDFRDGLIDRKGRLWIANLNEGLKVINPRDDTEIKLWDKKEENRLISQSYVKGILEGIDGKIWVATCSRGLFFFDENRKKFVNIQELPSNKGRRLGGDCINGLGMGPNGSILVSSWGGVAKLSADGQVQSRFSFKTTALNDTYCANMAETRDGYLWFSTNEGIHIANSKTYAVRYLTTIEGLKSNAPQGFYHSSANELYLGHINAINVLDINKLSNFGLNPKVVLSTVEVKGKILHQDLTKKIELRADENSITFNFSTLNFEPSTKNSFKYQLEGYEPGWVDLGGQHTVSFTNLPAKSYVLRVKSINSAGQESLMPLTVNLEVAPHFTNTWFFRMLIGLIIAALIVGMMRWRVDTLAERNKLDLQIAEWRLKALQSQMNPHFLFNSLNSVQNYLLTNRGVEGAKYLSKFSKLVRRIMENSSHQYLSFEKIIETLKMYVEIESFRFNHEFDYTFDIEENETLLDTHLPPMLLQPYVENAIWHGLMPKEGEKKLTIAARLEDKHIVCIIEDNGVGREFSPREDGHISRGQEMTKGIFESLRRKDSDARLELIDLYDADNKPAGTRVIMIIPIDNV